jgi:hypothetical protein
MSVMVWVDLDRKKNLKNMIGAEIAIGAVFGVSIANIGRGLLLS